MELSVVKSLIAKAHKEVDIDEDVNVMDQFIRSASRSQNQQFGSMKKLSPEQANDLEKQIRSLPTILWQQIPNHKFEMKGNIKVYNVGQYTVFILRNGAHNSGYVVYHKLPEKIVAKPKGTPGKATG